VPDVLAEAAQRVTLRYISVAEAAEYLNASDRTVRRLIADGELTGYRAGKSRRLIRVDLDEIDSKLMQPIGPHWNDLAARPRRRGTPRVPDRSAADAPYVAAMVLAVPDGRRTT
jgi:excisionase family DNA binding protein